MSLDRWAVSDQTMVIPRQKYNTEIGDPVEI